MTRKLLLFAAGLVIAWAAMVAGYAIGQRGLIYHPDVSRPDPAASGAPDMAVVSAKTGDGLTLSGWFAPPGEEQDAPVLLVFHGNAGNIGSRTGLADAFAAKGWGVLLAEYRGFGGNPGKPTEKGLYLDGAAWVGWLAEQGYSKERIVLYGESLGTGVATEMAARESGFRALALQSGFTSLAAVGRLHYPWLPVSPLLIDRYDSLSKLPSVESPVLVLHGARDTLVPATHGRALFNAAREPKKFVLFEPAGHNDLGTMRIAQETADFVESLKDKSAP